MYTDYRKGFPVPSLPHPSFPFGGSRTTPDPRLTLRRLRPATGAQQGAESRYPNSTGNFLCL